MPLFFDKVALLGVGLIGASVAKAMKVKGLCGSVAGYGRNIENLERAYSLGIIDSFSASAHDACLDADLVLLASPPAVFSTLVESAKDALKPGAIVTDVGSIKGVLVNELEGMMPQCVHYVGSHPIAGSEKSGIDESSEGLFESALCIVTPTPKTDKDALQKIIDLWSGIGAVVELIDPFKHDEIYAAVSHFPHMLAYELVNAVADLNPDYIRYAGQGFKDTTRIAMSSPELWRDISMLNSNELLKLIDIFSSRLNRMAGFLREKDRANIETEFTQAAKLRTLINAPNSRPQGE